jgi:hypothetical protein
VEPLALALSLIAVVISGLALLRAVRADRRVTDPRVVPELIIDAERCEGVLTLKNEGFNDAFDVQASFKTGHSSWVDISGPEGEADAVPELVNHKDLPLKALSAGVEYEVPLKVSELCAEQLIVEITWRPRRGRPTTKLYTVRVP